jgi:hypothetical protein
VLVVRRRAPELEAVNDEDEWKLFPLTYNTIAPLGVYPVPLNVNVVPCGPELGSIYNVTGTEAAVMVS